MAEEHNKTDAATLEALTLRCLDAAKARGADACEAATSFEEGLSVGVRVGEVESVEYQRDRAIGITVYFGHRKGSASTADFSPSAVDDAVEAACRIARHTAEDPCVGLADPARLAASVPDLDLDHPWPVSPEQALELALECENAARGADPRIVNSEGASVSSHRGLRCYANSHGFIGHAAGTHHALSCVVIAGADGAMQRDWWHTSARAAADLETAVSVGQRATARAVRRLGARRVPTTRVPVIFSPDVSRTLVAHVLSAASGPSQYRRSSFLLDALGERVMPESITVREEPLMKRGPASAAFDSEGVRTVASDIVDRGVLRTYLLDSYAARRLGRETTGHAGGWTNVSVAGDGDLASLARRMGRGLLVTELMGQGVNLVTGDYSRGAAGFWVDGGEVGHPVEEITIAGNLRAMLAGIVAVGADADPRHSIRIGSVLIDEMSLAGE